MRRSLRLKITFAGIVLVLAIAAGFAQPVLFAKSGPPEQAVLPAGRAGGGYSVDLAKANARVDEGVAAKIGHFNDAANKRIGETLRGVSRTGRMRHLGKVAEYEAGLVGHETLGVP